jgi:hypothetical protein
MACNISMIALAVVTAIILGIPEYIVGTCKSEFQRDHCECAGWLVNIYKTRNSPLHVCFIFYIGG